MKNKCKKTGFTLIELLVAIGLCLLFSVAMYQLLHSVRTTFTHSQNRLDILQTTRVVMTGIRNELRNALDKPIVYDDMLNIPITPEETVVYYFDKETRKLYRGKKKSISDPNPDVSEMRQYSFTGGQIISFEYDSSYRDSDAFVASELSLNSKIWFKVTMKILYSEKYDKLSKEDKEAILANPDEDARVKSFFMVITPRKVNWLLQATQ